MKKIVALLVMFLLAQTFVYAEQKADVIASVNGKNITKSFLDKELSAELALFPEKQQTEENKQALANKIINQKLEDLLLIDAAQKYKVIVSSTELKTAMDAIKNKYKDKKEFESNLKKQGLTKSSFEKEVKENIMKIKFVSTEIKNRAQNPTEEQIKSFYNNVISKMKGLDLNLEPQEDKLVSMVANNLKRIYSEQVKIRQIFIKYLDSYTKEQKKEVKNKMKELQKELSLQDVNFAQLSVKYSDDQALRQKKGDLGFVLKEDIAPEVAKVVFDLKVGEFNKKPIQISNGYHFFRVEEKKAKMPVEYDDIKASISELLYKQNIQNEYDKLLLELKEKADIKIYQK